MTLEQAIATSTARRSLGSPPALEMGSLARPPAARRHDFEVLGLLLGIVAVLLVVSLTIGSAPRI